MTDHPTSDEKAGDIDDWKSKFLSLELDNKKLRDEFNIQRAKMKELFMQKEGECRKLAEEKEKLKEDINEIKSQVLVAEYKRETDIQRQDRRAQEEIASLQQLVQETIEESSNAKSEIDRLRDEVEKMKMENSELRDVVHSQQQDTPSLLPVISNVKKTIARKLGGDSGNNDYLEDSMRKAQEDAEVLRSLVVPLEEEIKALKEKLRTTDEELQNYRGALKPSSETANSQQDTTNENASAISCKNCSEYLSKVVKIEAELEEERKSHESTRRDVHRLKEDLDREGALRRDLEEQWQEKREIHKREVEKLTEKVENGEREVALMQRHYADFKDDVNQELMKLTMERENIHRHLEKVQSDNEFLCGKYLATSQELQNQRIDLPNNVEDLQELLLQYHENLIEARVGCEHQQRESMTYLDEAQLLRDRLNDLNSERQAFERDVSTKFKSLETQLKRSESELDKLRKQNDALEKKDMELHKQASEFRVQIIELREANDKFEKQNNDLKIKTTVLQTELGNSEAVQKDFVRLSQSLQMELEKIRAADTAVRWQDDDDVENCPSCKSSFAVTRRKQHCRHCGTIYCEKCLTKSVPSGQRKKPARVCDVCHTLLVRNTAPYFSQAPPQSPT
ncbi:Early endosome antigen 1 [Pseudolycoriella hygida]|uniref:Early endosome antigen 1 n=1 Tax=Pseudolycoriella hygida TaxID=35572 RepID=A0A9Q0MQP3_9DIPT|nr:Early endosome antigen 1 [Pseudolycoriella hygida]